MDKNLWGYIRRRKLWQLLVMVSLVVVLEAAIVVGFLLHLQASPENTNDRSLFGVLAVFPLVAFFKWLQMVYYQFKDTFLEEFAAANGYAFDKNGTVDKTYGTIFRMFGNQQVSDVVSGTYNGSALRLFLYDLTIGTGRDKQHFEYTVVELDLHGQLPNLLMVDQPGFTTSPALDFAGVFGFPHTVPLEGDFNKYFSLHVQPGSEVEALEVFSPDLMALMEDESRRYTVECAGNCVYIYANGFLGTAKDMNRMFTLAKQLIDKLTPVAGRLKNDSIITAEASASVVRSTRPTPMRFGWFGTAFIVTMTVLSLGMVAWSLVTLFAHQQPTQSMTTQSQQTQNTTDETEDSGE